METMSATPEQQLDSYKAQYMRMLNRYISIESDALCVVGKLDQKFAPRFNPENVCYSQMKSLFLSDETAKYPHVMLLTHNLWYRVLTIYESKNDTNHMDHYTPCGLLACCFVVALAAVGGDRYKDTNNDHSIVGIKTRLNIPDDVITLDRLKQGSIYVMEQLGFGLFEPTMLHMIDVLIQLGEISDHEFMDYNESQISNPVLYSTILTLFGEPRFMCLPASLQTAGLLRYFGKWNGNCSRYLRRSDVEAFDAARLIYYSLSYMKYKLNTETEIAERFESTRVMHAEADEFVVDGITAKHGSEYEIERILDEIFGEICSICSSSPSDDNTIIPAETGYSVITDIRTIRSRFKEGLYIGRGGFGYVNHVTEKSTGATFAMKTMEMRTDDSKFFRDVENMAHEFAAARYLGSHRGIIDVIHSFRIVDESQILQQVRLYSESLSDSLAQQKGIDYYKSVVRGFITGLQAIHDRGFVHCDVKPGNILIDELKQSVIADMGLLSFPCSTTICDNVYTIPYRAPEVSNLGYVSWQADMWAVGVTLVEVFYACQKKNFMDDYNFTFSLVADMYESDVMKEVRIGQKTVYDISPRTIARANMEVCKNSLRKIQAAGPDFADMYDLLSKVMRPIDKKPTSRKRLTAAECLQHKFFN